MSDYEKAMAVMDELFSKDCIFAPATTNDSSPSVRGLAVFLIKKTGTMAFKRE